MLIRQSPSGAAVIWQSPSATVRHSALGESQPGTTQPQPTIAMGWNGSGMAQRSGAQRDTCRRLLAGRRQHMQLQLFDHRQKFARLIAKAQNPLSLQRDDSAADPIALHRLAAGPRT